MGQPELPAQLSRVLYSAGTVWTTVDSCDGK